MTILFLLAATACAPPAGDGNEISARTTTTVPTSIPGRADASYETPSPPRYDVDGNPAAGIGGFGPFYYRRTVSTEAIEAEYGDDLVTVRLAQIDAPDENACHHADALRWLQDFGTRFGTGMAVVWESTRTHFSHGAELVAYEALERTHDGGSLNVAMVRAGAARWQADPDAPERRGTVDFAMRMKAAEDDARSANRGLWGACPG